jgi:L-threonylcarbamoyladenylate synthase
MALRICKADAAQAFSCCKDVVMSGGVIAYPTDTFYGLGADPHNPAAVKKLFEIKGRHADQPILLLLPDPISVRDWVAEITPQAEKLMKRFWPGPLTLVFMAKEGVTSALTAGRGTIGLRVPGNALTLQLLTYLGSALTGTSANISGERNLETAEETVAAVGSMVDLVLDGGRTAGGRPSTVVDVTSEYLKIIRVGAIPFEALQE